MESKTCSKCQKEMPIENFYWHSTKQKYMAACKACMNGRNKKKYAESENFRNKKKELATRVRLERLQYVWDYLKNHPCVDCGETDIRVLEFDHVRGIKVIGITKAIQTGWDVLLNEIPKCDVRCANCHRKKTYDQLGWRIPTWDEGDKNE